MSALRVLLCLVLGAAFAWNTVAALQRGTFRRRRDTPVDRLRRPVLFWAGIAVSALFSVFFFYLSLLLAGEWRLR